MTPQFWLWLDTILMAVGGAAILVIGKRRTPSEEMHTSFHGIVPFIAASSYFAMAVGQGAISLVDLPNSSRIFYYARYIDWTFTTPLLLIVTAMTAIHSLPRRQGTIAAMVVADLLMIATALFFGLSINLSLKWTWFIISCAAFLPIYWVLWVPLMAEARTERDDVYKAYRSEATMLSALWFLYPVILFFSNDGTELLGNTASVALIAILDLVSKPVYGLFSVSNQTRIVTRDGSAGEIGGKSALRRAA